MSTLAEIMQELESLGNEQQVKTYRRHGANGPMFGVKVGDLKKIVKKIKGEQALALELWDTGNADAMYLAALVADGSKMTTKQLDAWAKSAWWQMLSEYSVAWVASEHPQAFSIAKKWMASKQAHIQTSGWSAYSAAISIRPDSELDLAEIEGLLATVESDIEQADNRVKYVMNAFVISVGSYVKPLLSKAKATAKRLGAVEVNVGDTACKVPLATEYISKIEQANRVGQKRKTAKC
ncbi:MAG: DNA alkylation repair protein [Pirellulaceae bacterium]|nr:DNA alkylation repair protein [Pirellulaceae bacterium]